LQISSSIVLRTCDVTMILLVPMASVRKRPHHLC
jgi:hypothetical protein